METCEQKNKSVEGIGIAAIISTAVAVILFFWNRFFVRGSAIIAFFYVAFLGALAISIFLKDKQIKLYVATGATSALLLFRFLSLFVSHLNMLIIFKNRRFYSYFDDVVVRFSIMQYLLDILLIAILAFGLSYLIFNLKKNESMCKKLAKFSLIALLPILFIALFHVIGIIVANQYGYGWGFDFLDNFRYVSFVLAIALLFRTLMGEHIEKNASTAVKTAEGKEIAVSDAYIDMTKHVLLLLFTFGIWLLIWIYRTTAYTSRISAEKRTLLNQLLLCMFVPFYLIYWSYKTAAELDVYGEEKGFRGEKIATPCLILAIFIFIVTPILIQNRINALESMSSDDKKESVSGSENDSIEELRRLKQLLDENLISQEDYDRKKQDLLNLQ